MQTKTVSKEKIALLDSSRSYAELAASANTARAYQADWSQFEAWCAELNKSTLPVSPDVLCAYLRNSIEQGFKISTVQRRLAAISQAHSRAGLPSPSDVWEVRMTMKRLRRENARPAQAKKPLSIEDLRAMLAHCPKNLSGRRDQAILLVGFCSALRRSELVQLTVSSVLQAKQGLVLLVPNGRNSTRKIALPSGKHHITCPVMALRHWLKFAKIESGPIFRAVNKSGRVSARALSDRIVGDIVKKYCSLIGKRPAAFSGYSLRTGFAIAATKAGASQSSIRRQTGHSSLEGLRRYTGEAAIFQDHPLARMDI